VEEALESGFGGACWKGRLVVSRDAVQLDEEEVWFPAVNVLRLGT
jgi:hypothetical protein